VTARTCVVTRQTASRRPYFWSVEAPVHPCLDLLVNGMPRGSAMHYLASRHRWRHCIHARGYSELELCLFYSDHAHYVFGCFPESKPVDISLELIVRRHFSSDASSWSAEKMWVDDSYFVF